MLYFILKRLLILHRTAPRLSAGGRGETEFWDAGPQQHAPDEGTAGVLQQSF
jgi:hypothetical protein